MRNTVSYLDFDLLLSRAEGGYRAQVLSSPAGEATADFAAPCSELELENFVLRIGRPRRGTRRISSPEMEAVRTLGKRLYDAVFSGDVRACWRASLNEAEAQNTGLRLRLRIADAPELNDVPWEYLYNASLNRFLSLSEYTPLIRYLDLPERIRPLTINTQLKILVMISSPTDYPRLDVEYEWSRLSEALAELIDGGQVRLERLAEARLGALQRALRRGEYHVLHFIGHGGFDPVTQDGVLVLCDEAGKGRRITAEHLGTMLHDHRSLRLAVLNACEGSRSSREDPFAGVAQTLVQQGVPAVIAMQFEITDEAAIIFADEFYAATTDGYPVDAALAAARKAIFATGNDIEWGTPVLYLRAPDGRLFSVNRERARQAEEDRQRAEAARQAEEDRQRAEAARQAEEDRQRAEAARQAEEDRQRAEAARQAEEDTQRAEAARQAEEDRQRAEAARQAEEDRQRAEAARQAEEDRQRAEAARQAEEDRQRAEAARQAEEEKRRGEQSHPWASTLSGHQGEVFSVALLPDGARALSGSGDKTVRLWDLRTGAELRRFDGHEYGIFSVVALPDGRRGLSGSGDGTIRVWDLETTAELCQLDCNRRAVNAVAVLPDGRRALSGSHDGVVRLWDLETGKELGRFTGHKDAVLSVTALADGRRALSASRDQTILLWDLEARSDPLRFEGHSGWVLSVTALEDGRRAFSGSDDHTARVWDLETGTQLAVFEDQTGSVYSVATFSNGKLGLSGSSSGIIHVLDLQTGTMLRHFEGHTNTVYAMAISPNGRWALSGSADGTLRRWEIGTDRTA